MSSVSRTRASARARKEARDPRRDARERRHAAASSPGYCASGRESPPEIERASGFGRSGYQHRLVVTSRPRARLSPSFLGNSSRRCEVENEPSLSRRRSRGVASRAPRRSRPTARGGSWSRPRPRAARLVSSRDSLAFVRAEPRPAAPQSVRAGIPRRAPLLATRWHPPGKPPRGVCVSSSSARRPT
jgi:hypothetical protein